MKKSKMLLSLIMMLGLSVSLFAAQPQEEGPDCIIPPEPQETDFCNQDMMSAADIDFADRECIPQDPHHKQFFFKKHFGDKFKKLNLTDKQKEDLKKLRETNRKTTQELTKKMEAKIKALNDELLKDTYSTKEVKKLTKDIKDISAKLIDAKAAKKEGMRKILTSEQYNKMFKVKTHYDILAERLGLSAEQKEKFIKILENKKDKETALKQQLREKNMLLKKEFDKENVDKKVIAKLSDEISNISKDLFKLDIDTKIELKSVLTTEQYNKFINPRPNPGKPIIYEPMAFDKNIDKK
ncbi:MAG: Spy/CpxP family protein refolding chaperone [Endomicrobiaceae bacterium]|nr:Spy/CpxP family protein refolding chaperone [Endomicrobiaceae bacterium]